MKKTNLKTKIIATALSAITVFSVSSMAFTSASAAVSTEAPVSAGGAGSFAKTAFGYVGKTLLNATSTKLANMAIGPVFNLIFGLDDGPSNQDVIDDVNKQAAEIKAKINEVMKEVQTLSENANKYHSEEMRQLQSIDSNISTLEFRKQIDKIADDYSNVLKRIDQNKDNFTCDGMGKLNNTTYKARCAISASCRRILTRRSASLRASAAQIITKTVMLSSHHICSTELLPLTKTNTATPKLPTTTR